MAFLAPPTPQQVEVIYSELGVTEASLERDVASLQEWLSKQPHLPSPADVRRLKLCLLYSKNSMEDAKRLLDLYYTMRGVFPEFFTERDPLRPELQAFSQVMCLAPLPNLTPDGCRINIFRLLDKDPSKFHTEHYIKWTFMTGEVRLLEDVSLHSVILLDLEGVTLAHFAKFTLPLVRKYAFCGQNVFMTRLKQIHVINAPSFVEKIRTFFKPFMKEKISNRIVIHENGSEGLLEIFPKDVLPEDYGGTLPSIEQINDEWNAKMVSFRDWFLREDGIRADESKRPSKSAGPAAAELELFGADGSFRKLELD